MTIPISAFATDGTGLILGAGATSVAIDILLFRDAANTLALRNGVNAQTFNVYNTYTDASNYERLTLNWNSSNIIIRAEGAGTGSRRPMYLDSSDFNIQTGSIARWNINSNGHLLAATDNTYDIGASGATRPRNLFVGTNATLGGQIIVSGIASDATHTDATVCVDTTSKQFYSGSGTLGICLGTSSLRYKSNVLPLGLGLSEIAKLETIRYRYLPGKGTADRDLYGFAAEQVVTVMPELVGLDPEGRPNSVDWAGLVPVLVNAMKEQQEMIEALQRTVDGLSATRH